MSCRHACFVAILAVGLILTDAPYGQESSNPYVMSHTETSTTDEAIATAMDLIRMEIERFHFELPRSHRIRFSSLLFKEGKQHLKVTSTVRFSASSGTNELLLVKFNVHRDNIRFGIRIGDDEHLTTGIPGSDDDTRFTASYPFAHAKLATRNKTPFYVLAADPDRVTEFGTDESEDRIEEYIKENKWVWIAYVELR